MVGFGALFVLRLGFNCLLHLGLFVGCLGLGSLVVAFFVLLGWVGFVWRLLSAERKGHASFREMLDGAEDT